jgi:hypothetical protein
MRQANSNHFPDGTGMEIIANSSVASRSICRASAAMFLTKI